MRALLPGVWRRTLSEGPLGITSLFILLTAVMTWPQVTVLNTHALEHQDVFFNLWRLRWIAHALATSPQDLFDANIFFPERGVLAYSDAMLVQGVLAAPLLWARVPPVLVHNLFLLGPIVASAVGISVLARHLSGSTAAGITAGVVFAFAPYRFEHYMHMELQWTVWSPWALWALQRTIETASYRFGLLLGVLLALQLLSSVYYGVFLAILIAVVAAVQFISLRGRDLVRVVRALVVGAALAAATAWVYSLPYAAAAARVGTRSSDEVRMFSARPRDYRAATPNNILYGSPDRGAPERTLFPGVLPALLAVAGLVLVPPTAAVIAYAIGLVIAFELSLGTFGYLYPLLYDHVGVVRALRAPARASMFFVLFLGVLAGRATTLAAGLGRTAARIVVAVICTVVLLEYRVAPLPLVEYHNEPPPLYSLLAQLPPGAVIEFPLPRPGAPPHHDARFTYMSTFHWMPLLNGYSGFYPPSYLRRLDRLARFPDEATIGSLRREHVRYIVVHEDGFPAGQRARIVERLLSLGLSPIAELRDGWGPSTVLELK